MPEPPDLRRPPQQANPPTVAGCRINQMSDQAPLSRIRSGRGRLRWAENGSVGNATTGTGHKNERATLGDVQSLGRSEPLGGLQKADPHSGIELRAGNPSTALLRAHLHALR